MNDATYNVTVGSQPSGQNCFLRNASGRIAGASVTNIAVACAEDQFVIGGTVVGLAGSGLVLQLNRSNDLPIVSSGGFAFEMAVPNGTAYEVTVRAQPTNPTQVCAVTNGIGNVSGRNVTNIAVSCASSSFSVGGTVSGLSGSGLVLQLNDGSDLGIASSGSFTFGTRVTSGAQYRVTVRTQPSNPAQVCTVGSGSGTIGNTNVTSVRVVCASNRFSVGGTLNGLLGTSLVLQNNGGDNITLNSDGPFTFPTELASGAAYNVTVRTQPSIPIRHARSRTGAALSVLRTSPVSS